MKDSCTACTHVTSLDFTETWAGNAEKKGTVWITKAGSSDADVDAQVFKPVTTHTACNVTKKNHPKSHESTHGHFLL